MLVILWTQFPRWNCWHSLRARCEWTWLLLRFFELVVELSPTAHRLQNGFLTRAGGLRLLLLSELVSNPSIIFKKFVRKYWLRCVTRISRVQRWLSCFAEGFVVPLVLEFLHCLILTFRTLPWNPLIYRLMRNSRFSHLREPWTQVLLLLRTCFVFDYNVCIYWGI